MLQQNLNLAEGNLATKEPGIKHEVATENLVGKNIQLFEQCDRRRELDAKYGD